MAGGFKSLAGHWLGGIAAKIPQTTGGFRSMLHHWMGGVSAPEGMPSNGGFVSMLHFWMGGVNAKFSPSPEAPTTGGWFDEHTYKKYRKYLEQLNSIKDVREITEDKARQIEEIIVEIKEADGAAITLPTRDEVNPDVYIDSFIREFEYARNLLEKKINYIENQLRIAEARAIQRLEDEELAVVLLLAT